MDRYDPSEETFNRIVAFICSKMEVQELWERSTDELLTTLQHCRPGYLRCFAIFMVDALIDNSGLRGLFGSPYYKFVTYAIDGYRRIGADELADILAMALGIVEEGKRALSASGSLSEQGLAGMAKPASSDEDRLEELSHLYWKADRAFQGGKVLATYPHVAINAYWEKYPEDFEG